MEEDQYVKSLEEELERLKFEKRQLEASYERALTSLADSEAKRETMESELKMAHEQIATLWRTIGESQGAGNATLPLSPNVDTISEFSLQCTVCGDNVRSGDEVPPAVRQQDVASHSQHCSAKPSNDIASSLDLAVAHGDRLLVSVTRTPSAATTWAPFKVVTKGNLLWLNKQNYSVFRSQGDFQWLFEALQGECPERIVPPLTAQTSLHATVAEFQRFMSRLSSHRLFCKHHLFVLFLTGTQEEVQATRNKHVRHPYPSHDGSHDDEALRPSQVQDKRTGALMAAKDYLSALKHSLTGLLQELERSGHVGDSPASYWFRVLSEGEPRETYLKEAAGNLSRVCADMEQHQGENEDPRVICQHLSSVLGYIDAALALLGRVEWAVDRFLYWDEEVNICEEMMGGDDEEDCSEEVAAEASSSCQEAKDYLEMMCKDLTAELASFDLQKERELRSVFMEYALLYCEKFQRFQSKWYSINVLMDSNIKPEVRAINFDSTDTH